MTALPRLQVERLTIAFGRRIVLRELSLAVPAGGVVALVGESGSGKTSAALALLGLLPPRARAGGRAWFWDAGSERRDLLAASEGALRRLRGDAIAWVPQESLAALDSRQTIASQMIEAAGSPVPRGEARRQAAALLAELGLADPERCLASYPFQLSGGERQRVLVAMALLPRPLLLVADEPTTALDMRVQARVLAHLRAARGLLGMAVLLITHDLAVAACLADDIVVLRAGQCVAAGPASRLLSQPGDDYTRALLAAVPKLPLRRRVSAAGPGAEQA